MPEDFGNKVHDASGDGSNVTPDGVGFYMSDGEKTELPSADDFRLLMEALGQVNRIIKRNYSLRALVEGCDTKSLLYAASGYDFCFNAPL